MNTTEIRQKYLILHNDLGSREDAPDKDLFDQQHKQVWEDCAVELEVRKTELKDKPDLTEDEKTELANLLFELPDPVKMPEGLPLSEHIGKLILVNPSLAKPAIVRRRFLGENYDVNCLVTQSVKDMFQAGDLQINDYVLVSFIEEIPNTEEKRIAIVTDKVYESW